MLINNAEEKSWQLLRGCPIKWFKHDSNANSDSKLQNVLLDYGLEGYGLYWYCIELIAGKVDADNITFSLEHDARIIARNTGCTPQKVEEMMRYFVSVGLFENSDGVITCMKMAKRLDQSMTSNKAMRAIIDQIKAKTEPESPEPKLLPDESHDGVMINHDVVMQEEIRLEEKRKDSTAPDGDQKQQSKKAVFRMMAEKYMELIPEMPAVDIEANANGRETKAANFYAKHKFTIERWEAYLMAVRECSWMFEDRPSFDGKVWKKKNFDFLITEKCYLGVKEDRYGTS